MPSSFCGTYGMKPTYGLVPYTGIMSIDVGIDHAGPITRNVHDNAVLLEVIVGADYLDPRQPDREPVKYSELLDERISGLRIGVLKEGFGHANSAPEVDAKVRAAADQFARLGATVSVVSIPHHLIAPLLWFPIAATAATSAITAGEGYGISPRDYYSTSLMRFHRNWRATSSQWPVTAKLFTMTGRLMQERSGLLPYAKANNLVRGLRAAYDEALSRLDLLLMPTTPMTATPLPDSDMPIGTQVELATTVAGNTMPFNLTGHPAMSIPCAASDGLPIGLMLVGRHHDEASIYRAALAYETATDWRTR
jgi:amidase